MDKRHRFDSWVKKISWRREWQPAPIFLAGESHGQRSLENYSPWGLKESDLAEATYHTLTHMGILLTSWTLFLSYLLLLDEFLPFWTTDSFDSVKSVGFFSEWFFFYTCTQSSMYLSATMPWILQTLEISQMTGPWELLIQLCFVAHSHVHNQGQHYVSVRGEWK